jgi:hypothetical protein
MIRLCVVGNSHVASLKKAWDELSGHHPDVQITFFACRGWHLFKMTARDGCLSCDSAALRQILSFTSGGSSEIRMTDYDQFLIYGSDARPYFTSPGEVFSRAVLMQSVYDSVGGTLAYHLLRQLRLLTDKPVYVGHCPLPGATAVRSRPKPQTFLDGIAFVNRVFYGPLNAELVPQPVETIVNGMATDPVYARGATKLAVGDALDDVAQPETDLSHMNGEFGKLWLTQFLDRHLRR